MTDNVGTLACNSEVALVDFKKITEMVELHFDFFLNQLGSSLLEKGIHILFKSPKFTLLTSLVITKTPLHGC